MEEIKIGTVFGRLTVLGLDKEKNEIEYARYKNGEIKSRLVYYICQCSLS